MRTSADAVVVGAGVIGASVALALANDGLRVVVVDRAGGPGQGSTSASSAIVRFNYSTYAGVATSWESAHCWRDWGGFLGLDGVLARFHPVGLVMLDVDLAPVARQTALFDACQIPWEHWDPETLAARLPGLSPDRCWPPRRLDDPAFGEGDGTLGALWTPDAGYVDDPALAAVNLCAAADAQMLFGRSVVGVDDGVVLEDGTVVRAPVVVNAAGPWSGELNRLAGVGAGWSVTTRPLRQEVHQVPASPVGVVVADLDLGTYCRPGGGGALLLGGTEPECDDLQWLERADDCSPFPTSALWDAQTTRVARRFPELGIPSTPTGVAGVYDVTQDWTPIYDRTEREGFYVAIGTSGNQFKNAPLAGRFLAALVRGATSYTGEHTGLTIDLAAFSRLRPRNVASTGTVMG